MIEILASLQGKGMRVLGLDHGARRIGVALSDRACKVASPLRVLTHVSREKTIAAIAGIVDTEGVGAIVVGLPLHLRGVVGARAHAAFAFAKDLETIFGDRGGGDNVALWDERWSSQAVERVLLEAGLSRARRAAARDKMAACWILQGALDASPGI